MKDHLRRKRNQLLKELTKELLVPQIALEEQLARVLALGPLTTLEVFPRSRLMNLGSFLCF